MSQPALCWIDAPVRRREAAPALRPPQPDPALPADPLAAYTEMTGLPFALADLASGMLTYAAFADLCPLLPEEVVEVLRRGDGPHVIVDAARGLTFYAVRLPSEPATLRLAAGFIPIDPTQPSGWLRASAAEAGWSGATLERWLETLQPISESVLFRLLGLAVARTCAEDDPGVAQQMDELAEQLDASYEELSLLHEIARNLRVSLDPVELAQICVHRLHRAIDAEGCGVLLTRRGEPLRLVTDGQLPCDEVSLLQLISGAAVHGQRRPVVRNHLEGTPLGAACPQVRNLIAAAVLEGDTPVGWIVGCNTCERSEFGTVEASLLNSIALILSTHLHNVHLFMQQEELLVAFVRSLVSTLDAKDSYTRGHSERVAHIARRLAQQLGLSPADQEAVHLSALLHDIGKIGIEDAILGKPGRLTEAEFRKLQLHPVIGHDILSELKNLHHILPGVRNHHESFDGTGYPDRLVGEQIPLMARILAVADAFDAMGSDRPYRGGMPLEQIERILNDGAGTQWDARVVRAYFAARDDIRRIWEMARDGAGPLPE